MTLKPYLFSAILALFFHTFGQENVVIGVGDRSEQLVKFFNVNHLQPRTIDKQFGEDVNDLFLTSLDENKFFFYKEDILNINKKSTQLSSEIETGQTAYLNFVETLFLKRIDEVHLLLKKVLDQKEFDLFDNTIKFSYAHTEYVSTPEEFNQRWSNRILKTLHNELINVLNLNEEYNQDSVLIFMNDAIEETRKTYINYLTNISEKEDYMELLYMNSIAKAYDPHSNYFNANLKKSFTEELSSEHLLFGISYQSEINGEILITEVTPGSSAWYSDEIHVGDAILSIRNEEKKLDVSHATLKELSSFFDELTSTTIQLELKTKKGVVKTVSLTKSKVYSNDDIIKSAVLDGENKVGYISLPDFYTNWTDTSSLGCANDIAKSILKLKKNNIDGLIIDLRNNGGGSIKEAIDLVGIFINYGPVVIEKTASGDIYTYKDFHRGSIYRGPLIFMVNNGSASASELVTGAIQDYNRGIIVGQTTYGKATGQGIQSLDPIMQSNLSSFAEENTSWGYVKTTSIGLYRITKKSLQGKGVKPDIKTTPIDYNYDGIVFEKDLPHFIQLDSIDKKVYYTTKAELPIAKISSDYKGKKDSITPILMKLQTRIDELDNQLKTSCSIKTSYDLLKKINSIYEEYNQLIEQVEFNYSPISTQFNPEILQISPYLKKYNTQFIERLSKDLELNEVYKIMEIYIKNMK